MSCESLKIQFLIRSWDFRVCNITLLRVLFFLLQKVNFYRFSITTNVFMYEVLKFSD